MYFNWKIVCYTIENIIIIFFKSKGAPSSRHLCAHIYLYNLEINNYLTTLAYKVLHKRIQQNYQRIYRQTFNWTDSQTYIRCTPQTSKHSKMNSIYQSTAPECLLRCWSLFQKPDKKIKIHIETNNFIVSIS